MVATILRLHSSLGAGHRGTTRITWAHSTPSQVTGLRSLHTQSVPGTASSLHFFTALIRYHHLPQLEAVTRACPHFSSATLYTCRSAVVP